MYTHIGISIMVNLFFIPFVFYVYSIWTRPVNTNEIFNSSCFTLSSSELIQKIYLYTLIPIAEHTEQRKRIKVSKKEWRFQYGYDSAECLVGNDCIHFCSKLMGFVQKLLKFFVLDAVLVKFLITSWFLYDKDANKDAKMMQIKMQKMKRNIFESLFHLSQKKLLNLFKFPSPSISIS